jgi:hypothetical protein
LTPYLSKKRLKNISSLDAPTACSELSGCIQNSLAAEPSM